MRGKTYTRRQASTALGVFAGVTILASRKTVAQRAQKLVDWHLPTFDPTADDAMRDHFDEFREMAGLSESEAAFVPTSSVDLMSRLQAALKAGMPPDVVRLSQSDLQLCRARGELLDATDVVERLRGYQGGLFESCLRALAHEGGYWGVPFAIETWPMHARLDVLEQHGLDYPRTWDSFVEICMKIQKPPFYGFGMDLGLTEDATNSIMQLCWGFGGRIYDAEGKAAFDNDGNVRGFAFINEMYNKHRIIPKRAIRNSDGMWNNNVYASGRVAFVSNPTSLYASLSIEDPELMKKTGLFGLPAGPAGAINQIDTWSLGLFKHTPYPELSKGLVEYFMEPTRYNDVIVKNNGRFVPVYPDLFNDSWWTERPEFSEFTEIARTGVPISYEAPPSAASDEVLATNVVPKALQTVLTGGVDPADAVAAAHAEIAAISERFAAQEGG